MRTFRVSIGVAIGLALLLACGEASPPEAETGALDGVVPEPPAAPEPAPEPAAAPRPVPTPAETPPVLPAAPEPPPVAAKPQPPPPPEPEPEAVPQPEPEVALDLDDLERRLKETSALGVLTKLALKNEIDDLIDDVGKFHQKKRGELAKLRERFELLLMKVTSLLQDKEPELAREVAGAREGLWKLLADPGEFAKLSA